MSRQILTCKHVMMKAFAALTAQCRHGCQIGRKVIQNHSKDDVVDTISTVLCSNKNKKQLQLMFFVDFRANFNVTALKCCLQKWKS